MNFGSRVQVLAMRERTLVLALGVLHIATLLWMASFASQMSFVRGASPDSDSDSDADIALPCTDQTNSRACAHIDAQEASSHNPIDAHILHGHHSGRRRRPSQTARRYQPLPRPTCSHCSPSTSRVLVMVGSGGGGGLPRERLRRCAATERVEGIGRLSAAIPRDKEHIVVVVQTSPDWPHESKILDILYERLGNVSLLVRSSSTTSLSSGMVLEHRCWAMKNHCLLLDSLVPFLLGLGEEEEPASPTLPLDQYDVRWISGNRPGSSDVVLDSVLPEPSDIDSHDEDISAHEAVTRPQMSLHKQLEHLVTKLCERDRSQTYFIKLHPSPFSDEDLTPTMPPETALSLGDILPTNPKHYDKNRAPKLAGQPTIVYFHVTVLSLDSINEESMTYVADIFLAQSWRDPRLRLPENMSEEYRILDVEWLHDIWRPDCFFKNAKKVTFHEMSIPNHYLWLYHDKTLLYMSKLTLVLSCAMKFESYPHDTQICSMSIESLSHTVHDLVFIWNMTDPLVVNPEIELPQLDISNNYTADCTIEYSTGNFTCLAVVFNLRRRLGYHLFHSYIPSALIVIMSWISFWIKPEAIPARVTLGVTSLLTLATQNTQSQQSLPPVSYVKAIDVWMSSCSVFVFLSLMEFAVVNNYMGPVATKAMKGYSEEDIRNAMEDFKELEPRGRSPSPNRTSVPTVPQYDTCCNGRETALYIDKLSRFFFPFSFFILNVVYWSTFL